MTFVANIPNAGQSPGLFPPQNGTNFTRLQTIITADHVFNATAAANDGFHKQVTMPGRTVPGSVPAGANGILYVNSSNNHLSYYNGTNYQLTPTIKAAVNFDGTGAVGIQVIRSASNVTSVTKNAKGDYTINFASVFADNNYIVSATGMRDALDDISNGQVRGNTVYGNSVTTTSVRIQFNGGTSSLQDVLMGNILIYSTT